MSVRTRHPQYLYAAETWLDLRNAYIGQTAVKGARATLRAGRGSQVAGTRYLPRPNGMRRDDQYLAYVDRATWLGATERTVGGMTGSVFRREPQISAPTALEPQLADVTQTGISLRMFAEEAVRETLLMGRFGVLVDFPKPVEGPDGQLIEPPPDARPYWVAYPTERIVNWRTMQREGDTLLSLVVLEEVIEVPRGPWGTDDFFQIEYQTQYRVLRLDEQGHYEESLWTEAPGPAPTGRRPVMLTAIWFPNRHRQPLDFIPFCFMAPFSLEPDVEKSLIEALVQVNYRHYRHSASYEHALWWNGLPTPWVAGTLEPMTELTIGGSTAWILPADAKVGMLQTDPAGLPAYQIAMDQDKAEMGMMGARLLEDKPSVQETLGAVMMRHASGDSPIQSLVSSVSQGLTWALQVHAWWAGLTENIDDPGVGIALNKDLVSSSMTPQMLTALTQALLQNTISYDTFWYNLQQGEIARPFVDVEEEQALIDIQKAQQPLAPVPTPLPPGGSPPPGRNGARQAA